MTFRPERKPPDFAAIKAALNTSGMSSKNNAAYQAISSLIDNAQILQDMNEKRIVDLEINLSNLTDLVNQFFREFGWTP